MCQKKQSGYAQAALDGVLVTESGGCLGMPSGEKYCPGNIAGLGIPHLGMVQRCWVVQEVTWSHGPEGVTETQSTHLLSIRLIRT